MEGERGKALYRNAFSTVFRSDRVSGSRKNPKSNVVREITSTQRLCTAARAATASSAGHQYSNQTMGDSKQARNSPHLKISTGDLACDREMGVFGCVLQKTSGFIALVFFVNTSGSSFASTIHTTQPALDTIGAPFCVQQTSVGVQQPTDGRCNALRRTVGRSANT